MLSPFAPHLPHAQSYGGYLLHTCASLDDAVSLKGLSVAAAAVAKVRLWPAWMHPVLLLSRHLNPPFANVKVRLWPAWNRADWLQTPQPASLHCICR